MNQFSKEEIEFIKGLRVLYFEDDYVTSKFASRCFLNYFDTIEVYNNPSSSINKIDFKKYDLVITDIAMPGINGMELIKEIKKSNDKIDFIVLSAHADSDLLLKSIKLGVYGYMEKPMVIEEFEEILFRLIKKDSYKKRIDFSTIACPDDKHIRI